MSEQERKEDVLTEGNAGDNLGQVSGALKALLPELANIRQILTGNRVFDNSDDGYMSIQKAANWLSVSCDTIRRALQIGTLKAYRLP